MTFTETKWNEISEKISGTFRLKGEEKEQLQSNRLARLIAAIPYLADCDEPERTALANLGTYMIAKDESCKDVYAHHHGDNKDILERLRLLNHFHGGNKAIIKRGMDLIALVQLKDHHYDIEEDRKIGKYNPVNDGAWDYDKMYEELTHRIQEVACPDMDAIMPVGQGTDSWWDNNETG